ncbi:A-kinase anchor protein 10-like protein [Dinothrombium tinctorium]|uniref:A-kinase anchor protein 10-like protein n=1 Tax=Dinothrombium tinctorium TaxID=1965070 RepID=A0A3S3RI05_9ACAR|nr:A-kinase anchor protein 10-like protein [Dinothrombium tinctorium]RWS02391.1 A-kinase anchor protein 10-like protein [Dinothrombium tinctorium]RWS04445.1 A-kinase anchor protein 10-like protein [Dinothrombium tinctorium]
MLIAESMFDPCLPLKTESKLCPKIVQIMNDSNRLSYFVQFMENEGLLSKNMIKFWIQVECFKNSLKNCEDFEKNRLIFIEDAVRIFKKYLDSKSNSRLHLNFDESEILFLETRLSQQNNVTSDIFDKYQNLVLSHIESEYYNKFLRSSYFCKYQVDMLTDGSISLVDILYNDSTLFYFMEFMEQEGMKHYVDFLLMAENYRNFGTSNDAIVLFNRFFSSESSSFLEMSDKIKCQIERELQRVSNSCFDIPMSILIQYFDKTYFKQFLQSQTYINFLTECINSIQSSTMASKSIKCHKRQSSDSSSSVMSDCCVAGNSSSSKEKKATLSSTKPDQLWQRDLAGKLQIARVNQYGKLLSDFEPEPDKSNSLGAISLSKAVKRLTLSASDEKEKEDMAWQVAEMIINDIRHVTDRQRLLENKS